MLTVSRGRWGLNGRGQNGVKAGLSMQFTLSDSYCVDPAQGGSFRTDPKCHVVSPVPNVE